MKEPLPMTNANWLVDEVEKYVRGNMGGAEPYAPEVARLFAFVKRMLGQLLEKTKNKTIRSGASPVPAPAEHFRVDKGLSFHVFRDANLARLPLFKNAKGTIVHPADGSNDWTPEYWLQAVIGELGEYANLRKKVVRGDFGDPLGAPLGGKHRELAKELADVFCYLDLLANSLGINLGAAVIQKFNEVSDRVGLALKIAEDGQSFTHTPPPVSPPPAEDMFMVVVNSGGAVFVKEFEFFKRQGGMTEEWGRGWTPIRASSIAEARAWGCLNLPGARPYDGERFYEDQEKP